MQSAIRDHSLRPVPGPGAAVMTAACAFERGGEGAGAAACAIQSTSGRIDIKNTIYQFWTDDGQDLVEYTLLLAFVTLGAAGLMRGAGSSVNTVWSAASTTLSNAAAKAS